MSRLPRLFDRRATRPEPLLAVRTDDARRALRLRRRLAGAVGAALLFALAGAGAALHAARARSARGAWVRQTHAVLLALDDAAAALAAAETSQRGFLLTGNPAYLARGRTAPAAARAALDKARHLTHDNPAQQLRIAALAAAADAKLAQLAETVRLAGQGDRVGAVALVRTGRGERLSTALAGLIADARGAERALLVRRLAAEVEAARGVELGLGVVGLGAIAAAAAGAGLLRREATRSQRAEDDLRALFAAMPDAVFVLDRDGTYRRVVETAPGLLSRPAAALLGRRVQDFFPPEESQAFLAAIRGALDEGQPVPLEYALDVPAGDDAGGAEAAGAARRLWFAGTASPLTDDAVLWVARDVTARVTAEAAHVAAEARYRAAMNGSSRAFAILRAVRGAAAPGGGPAPVVDFEFVDVNPAAAEQLGTDADDVVGSRLLELFPRAREWGLFDLYRTAVDAHTRYDGDVEIADPRLGAAWWRLLVVPLGDADPEAIAVTSRDVTAEKHADAAVRASEARFRGVLENLRAFAVQLDAAGRVTFANDALLAATGWSREEAVGNDWFERFVPDGHVVRAVFASTVAAGRADELPAHYENEILTRDGARRMVAWDNVVLRAPDGRAVGTASVGQDVTAQRAAEAALAAREAELRGVLAASPDCVKTLGLDGRLLSVNATGCRLLEIDGPEQVVGRELASLFPEGEERAAVGAALEAARAGRRGQVQAPAVSARGTPKWWDVAVTAIAGPDGAPARLLCVSREITAMKRAEAELRELSTRDELTGLLNRRGFRPLAEQMLALGRDLGRNDAVLCIDLDAFKPINDQYGHAAGDEALQAVARVLRDTVRQSDLAARLGGDEFTVYAVGLGRAGEGALLSRRLRAALDADNAAAAAAGRPWSVGMSIGVVETERGDDLDALLARADAALYAAKAARPRCARR